MIVFRKNSSDILFDNGIFQILFFPLITEVFQIHQLHNCTFLSAPFGANLLVDTSLQNYFAKMGTTVSL